MRTVVLTGAAGNLGRAVASAFAQAGDNLVLLDLKPGALPDGERQLYIATNLLDAPSVQAAVDKTVQRFKRIDVLCNIAGAFRMGAPVHETSDADWNFLTSLRDTGRRRAEQWLDAHFDRLGVESTVDLQAVYM